MEKQLVLEDRTYLLGLYMLQVQQAVVGQWLLSALMFGLIAHQTQVHWSWLALVNGINAVRWWRARRDAAQVAHAAPIHMLHMERRHNLLALLAGLAWGALPWLGYRSLDPVLDFLVGAIVIGFCGSVITTLAAIRWAATLFLVPTIFSFTLKGWLLGPALYTSIAWVTLFALAALLYYGRTVRANLLQTVLLRRQNASLVEQLQAEKHTVEEQSRIKSLFLAGVSHDLKHPITALGHYLAFARTALEAAALPAGLSTPLQQAHTGMEQAVLSMSSQLDRLLELSKLESGEIQAAMQSVQLESLLQAKAQQWHTVAQAHGLNLRWRVGTGMAAVQVQCDPSMLHSVLDNLLDNALRYTRQGGVLLSVRQRASGWWLEVWDTGPGLPQHQLPLLFEAYRRFDDTRTGQSKGFGLGLALVKLQCQRMGWTVQVRSRQGRGSVFRVGPLSRG